MKDDVWKAFEDSVIDLIEGMVSSFDRMNLTSEQIMEDIEDMHELTRGRMYQTALSIGNKELAGKIDKANELIKLRRIDAFKKSVANGTHEEFLANMSWPDKCSLSIDMGLFRWETPDEKPSTEEEQIYSDIIESSIDKDIEKEALSQGFESVEAWRKHNAMQCMDDGLQIEMHTPHGIKRMIKH